MQVLSSDLRGDQAPVLAAVGPLQFDVVLHRLEHEFGARAELEHLGYTLARRTDPEGAASLAGQRGTEVLTRRLDGALLALFTDKWRLAAIQRDRPVHSWKRWWPAPLDPGGDPPEPPACATRPAVVLRPTHRPLAGHKARLAGPVTSVSP